MVNILNARNVGMEKGAKAAGCTILEKQVNQQDNNSGALPIVQAWKTKYGSKMTAILAYNDPSAEGAIAAKSGDFQPIVTGMNGDPDGLAAVKNGSMFATGAVPNVELGEAMAQVAEPGHRAQGLSRRRSGSTSRSSTRTTSAPTSRGPTGSKAGPLKIAFVKKGGKTFVADDAELRRLIDEARPGSRGAAPRDPGPLSRKDIDPARSTRHIEELRARAGAARRRLLDRARARSSRSPARTARASRRSRRSSPARSSPTAARSSSTARRARSRRPREALDAGIALVTQEPTACPSMSVAENLLLTRLPKAAVAVPAPPLQRPRPAAPRADRRARRSAAPASTRCAPATASSSRSARRSRADPRDPDPRRVDEPPRRGRRRAALRRAPRAARPRHVDRPDHPPAARDRRARRPRGRAARRARTSAGSPREELTEEKLAATMVGRELESYYHKRELDLGAPVLQVERPASCPARASRSRSTVRAGEVVGLAGLVGAGRTELLETIFGVRRAHGGRVLVDGREVAPGSPRAALEHGLALVPEERHRQGLNMTGCVRENITMGTWPLWLAPAGAPRSAARASELLERLRIRTAGIEAPIRSLSGGNQQKVVIARCLDARAARAAPRRADARDRRRRQGGGLRADGELLEHGMAIVLVSSEMLEILGLCRPDLRHARAGDRRGALARRGDRGADRVPERGRRRRAGAAA